MCCGVGCPVQARNHRYADGKQPARFMVAVCGGCAGVVSLPSAVHRGVPPADWARLGGRGCHRGRGWPTNRRRALRQSPRRRGSRARGCGHRSQQCGAAGEVAPSHPAPDDAAHERARRHRFTRQTGTGASGGACTGPSEALRHVFAAGTAKTARTHSRPRQEPFYRVSLADPAAHAQPRRLAGG